MATNKAHSNPPGPNANSTDVDDYFTTKKGRELARAMYRNVVESALKTGQIDPRGKDATQLKQEILKFINEFISSKEDIQFFIDHRSSLLTQARKNLASKQPDIAIILYATWIEHWANHLIATIGQRNGLTDDDILSILRESNFRAKFTWIPVILGLPRIQERHRLSANRVAEFRNSFVHYKWQPTPETASARRDKEQTQVLREVEPLIKYLNRYENRHVYRGYKSKIHSF